MSSHSLRKFLIANLISPQSLSQSVNQPGFKEFCVIKAPKYQELTQLQQQLLIDTQAFAEYELSDSLTYPTYNRALAHTHLYQLIAADNSLTDDDVVLVVEEGTILATDWQQRVSQLLPYFQEQESLNLIMLANDLVYDPQYYQSQPEKLLEVCINTTSNATYTTTSTGGLTSSLFIINRLNYVGASAYLIRKRAIRNLASSSINISQVLQLANLTNSSDATDFQAIKEHFPGNPIAWRADAWHRIFNFTNRSIAYTLPTIGMAAKWIDATVRLAAPSMKRINQARQVTMAAAVQDGAYATVVQQQQGALQQLNDLIQLYQHSWASQQASHQVAEQLLTATASTQVSSVTKLQQLASNEIVIDTASLLPCRQLPLVKQLKKFVIYDAGLIRNTNSSSFAVHDNPELGTRDQDQARVQTNLNQRITATLHNFRQQVGGNSFIPIALPELNDPALQSHYQQLGNLTPYKLRSFAPASELVRKLRLTHALRRLFLQLAHDATLDDDEYVLITNDNQILDPLWQSKLEIYLSHLYNFIPEANLVFLTRDTITDFSDYSNNELSSVKIYATADFIHDVGFKVAGFARVEYLTAAQLTQRNNQALAYQQQLAQSLESLQNSERQQSLQSLQNLATEAVQQEREQAKSQEQLNRPKNLDDQEQLNNQEQEQEQQRQLLTALQQIPYLSRLDASTGIDQSNLALPLLGHYNLLGNSQYLASNYQLQTPRLIAINTYNPHLPEMFLIKVGCIRKGITTISSAQFDIENMTSFAHEQIYNILYSMPALSFSDNRDYNARLQQAEELQSLQAYYQRNGNYSSNAGNGNLAGNSNLAGNDNISGNTDNHSNVNGNNTGKADGDSNAISNSESNDNGDSNASGNSAGNGANNALDNGHATTNSLTTPNLATGSLRKYLINLKSQPQRLAYMQQQPGLADFKLIEAVYGKDLSQTEKDRLFDLAKFKEVNGREVIDGEIGCTLSHYNIYQEVVNDSSIAEDDFVLISEDDATYHQHWQQHLTDLNNYLAANPWTTTIDFILASHIFLTNTSRISRDKVAATRYIYTNQRDAVTVSPELELLFMNSFYPHGSSCYLVRKRALRNLVTSGIKPYWVADDFTKFISQQPNNYLLLNPPLSYQNTALESTIAADRNQVIMSKRIALRQQPLLTTNTEYLRNTKWVIQQNLTEAEIAAKFPGYNIQPKINIADYSESELAKIFDRQAFKANYGRDATDAEIERALGHYYLLKRISETTEIDFNFTLIVEDDVATVPDLTQLANYFIAYLDSRISLETYLICLANDEVSQPLASYSKESLIQHYQLKPEDYLECCPSHHVFFTTAQQQYSARGYCILGVALRNHLLNRPVSWLADDFIKFIPRRGDQSWLQVNPCPIGKPGSQVPSNYLPSMEIPESLHHGNYQPTVVKQDNNELEVVTTAREQATIAGQATTQTAATPNTATIRDSSSTQQLTSSQEPATEAEIVAPADAQAKEKTAVATKTKAEVITKTATTTKEASPAVASPSYSSTKVIGSSVQILKTPVKEDDFVFAAELEELTPLSSLSNRAATASSSNNQATKAATKLDSKLDSKLGSKFTSKSDPKSDPKPVTKPEAQTTEPAVAVVEQAQTTEADIDFREELDVATLATVGNHGDLAAQELDTEIAPAKLIIKTEPALATVTKASAGKIPLATDSLATTSQTVVPSSTVAIAAVSSPQIATDKEATNKSTQDELAVKETATVAIAPQKRSAQELALSLEQALKDYDRRTQSRQDRQASPQTTSEAKGVPLAPTIDNLLVDLPLEPQLKSHAVDLTQALNELENITIEHAPREVTLADLVSLTVAQPSKTTSVTNSTKQLGKTKGKANDQAKATTSASGLEQTNAQATATGSTVANQQVMDLRASKPTVATLEGKNQARVEVRDEANSEANSDVKSAAQQTLKSTPKSTKQLIKQPNEQLNDRVTHKQASKSATSQVDQLANQVAPSKAKSPTDQLSVQILSNQATLQPQQPSLQNSNGAKDSQDSKASIDSNDIKDSKDINDITASKATKTTAPAVNLTLDNFLDVSLQEHVGIAKPTVTDNSSTSNATKDASSTKLWSRWFRKHQ